MPWLLNLAYALLLCAISPLLLYRILVVGKYRVGWREKLWGALPARDSDRPCLWLHAVSVGEVLQLQPIMAELRHRLPGWEFMITTTTETGRAVAEKTFPQHTVCYFPLDFSWAVRRAIYHIRPTAVVLVELELWPNFTRLVTQCEIPLALINARISDRSFRGYRRIRPLMKTLLSRLTAIAAQNELYFDRLVELGARPERTRITGSIKFDRIQTDRQNSKTQEIRTSFGIRPEERVLIAGSTQHPEEALAVDTWLELKQQFADLRLVLVPRHKERFAEVAQMLAHRNLPFLRRSDMLDSTGAAATVTDVGEQSAPILLLDTLGELSACWGLADIAFVGGSLSTRGGQNMIEPAGYGSAVLFGPNTQNFRDVVAALLHVDAARVVADGSQLTATVRELLQDSREARRMGAAARELVLSQQGATSRTVEILLAMLADSPNTREIRAAG